MASAAAGETILFIGAILAATIVAASLGGIASEYATGTQARSRGMAQELRSGIQIVNDAGAVPTAPLKLYIKNTGTEALDPGRFVVLVDGVASASTTVTVGGVAATAMPPGALATLTVLDIAPGAGDHRVVVVADHGAQDDLEFTS